MLCERSRYAQSSTIINPQLSLLQPMKTGMGWNRIPGKTGFENWAFKCDRVARFENDAVALRELAWFFR